MSTTLFFIFLTLSSISAINIKKITQTNKYCIPEAENIVDEQPTCYFRCESFQKLSQKLKDSKCIEKSCINSCCLCPRECLASCKFQKTDSQYKNPYFYNQKCVNNCCERKNDWTDKYVEKNDPTEEKEYKYGPEYWARCVPEYDEYYNGSPTCYKRCISKGISNDLCLEKCCTCTSNCINECEIKKTDVNFKKTKYWGQHCYNSCCSQNLEWINLYK